MKKIISLFLSLIIVLGVLTSVPITVSSANVEDLTYELNDDGQSYYVCINRDAVGHIVIPESYNNLPVTRIDCCKSINVTSIVIPKSIKYISGAAFYEMYDLNAVYITDVASWCNIEFEYMDGYGNSSNPLCYADDLYINGELVKDIVIPEGVTKIPEDGFSCKNIVTVEIPNSVTSIGDSAFYGCSNLTSVVISDSVTRIGFSAFDYCKLLDSVFYTGSQSEWSVISIAAYNSYLTDADIHYNTDIENWKTHYGEPVTKQEPNCTQSGSYTYVCPCGYEKIDVLPAIGHSYVDGVCITCEATIGMEYLSFEINEDGTMYQVKECDTEVSGDVVIPSVYKGLPVTKIASNAFSDCERLESITIPDSVTSIGDSAFLNCTSLTSITIPDGVISIGGHLFDGCTSLTSIEIPDSVISIDTCAFASCTSLTSITLPDSITSIGDFAFSGCTSLTSITLPDSITSIGDFAFSGCTSLTSIILPKSITDIEARTFSDCTSLTSISIPDGVKYISPEAFYNCSSLTTISIPDSVIRISYQAFGYKYSSWEEKTVKIEDFTIYGYKGSAAEKYANDNGFDFVKLECEKHIASSWIIDTKATVNTAGSKHKECTKCGEVLETAKIPQLKCSKPKLKTISNTEYGVKITWGKVSGADKYDVYRKTGSSGKYSKIGNTSKTYYTDKKASSGKKYYYYVKAVNEAGSSEASSSKSIYHLADTTLSTPKSTKSGITLKWKKVTGADGYMVYRKTGTGSYTKIATVKGSSKVTYTDKSAKKGKKYTYKVKAYKSKTYSAYSNTKTIKDKY